MLAAVRSAAVLGIDAYDVLVEVDVSKGLPIWTVVGLPAAAVKESTWAEETWMSGGMSRRAALCDKWVAQPHRQIASHPHANTALRLFFTLPSD